MGSLSNESFEQVLDSLKKAGITISNEAELRERLAEAQRWRFAFQTLAANGKTIGICFEDHSEGRNGARFAWWVAYSSSPRRRGSSSLVFLDSRFCGMTL